MPRGNLSKLSTAQPPRTWDKYRFDFVRFVDERIQFNELGQPFRLQPFQRELFRVAFTFDKDGRLAWDTWVYSCPKKSGKTTLNGLITDWWGLTQEAPNDIYVLANDQEQAQSRAFAAASKILKRNGIQAITETRKITLPNETTIQAVASDYASSAGSNHGLTSWDELWAYTSEGSVRLWDELTPVPTRLNSIRLISTYAGFEGESKLLRELYIGGVDKAEHPDGLGERIHPTLPLYLNRERRLLVYWDHEPRMPWQDERYYRAQKAALRPNAYLRFHENKWTSSEATFITGPMWDRCVDKEHFPVLAPDGCSSPIFIGIDASTKHDSTAVLAIRWRLGKVEMVQHRIWRPTPEQPMDLEASVERYVLDLRKRGFHIKKIYADPYQLHRSISTLKAKGLPIEEYAQTPQHGTEMGEALMGLLNGGTLRAYQSAEVREQALNTVAEESARGWRVSKEKSSKKIDSIIALAMACVAAIEHGPIQSEAVVTSFTKTFGQNQEGATRIIGPREEAKHSECGGRCGLNVLLDHNRAWLECPYVTVKERRARAGTSCMLEGCPHPSHAKKTVDAIRARLSRDEERRIRPDERTPEPRTVEAEERLGPRKAAKWRKAWAA